MTLPAPDLPPAVNTFYLHLTRACNLRCRYCYFAAGKAMRAEMTLEEYRLLFEDIARLATRKVVFTGGEPLLRADLFELARAFRQADSDRRIRLALISNGALMDAGQAAQAAECFDEVRISLDGSREVHDRLRGRGSYDAALKAIANLRNAGLFAGVSITVTALNLPGLADFMGFLFNDLQITEFHLAPFRPVGRGAARPALACSWDAAQQAAMGFWSAYFGSPSSFGPAADHSLAVCGKCGIGGYINIHPDGSVYPCHVLSVPEFYLGNVRQARLAEIVQNSGMLKRLGRLDFMNLEGGSPRLKRLLKSALCLGEVYRDAPEELALLL